MITINNIQFTPKEQKIINLLKSVIYNKAPHTTLRIAGGYIRDKLLCVNSSDIDIAIDNMTGEAFANLVIEYMSEHGLKKQNITVVEANPDQSKHLATAMIRLFGLPIDFVNLRTETYASTRIPTMQIGTPIEDAQRRDLTINSLFYNINRGEVEDFVGGIQDLNARIARTPLNPIQTFLDDPLRILRTIRFASKYDLKLEADLIKAAQMPDVKLAFKTKISSERIWAELAGKKDGNKYKPGALIGNNPTRTVELLMELGLMELIFDPTEEEVKNLAQKEQSNERMVPWKTPQNNNHHAFDIWNHTLSVVRHMVKITSHAIQEDHETYLVRNLSALLHDIGKRYTGIQGISKDGIHTSYNGHEKISARIAESVLMRLRVPQDIIKRVVDLIYIHLRPHVMVKNGKAREYRRFVRDHSDWMHSIDLAIADSLGKKDYSDEEYVQEVKKYEYLREKIKEAMQWDGKPKQTIQRPISGKDLLDFGIKQGPIFGKIFTQLDEILLDNPGMSKEEALMFVSKFIE